MPILRPLTVLLLLTTAGCAFIAPTPEQKVQGVYEEREQTPDGKSLVATLWLEDQGKATFDMVEVGKPRPEVQHGRWWRMGDELTVQLEDDNGNATTTPLVWGIQNSLLMPKRWDHDRFGADGLQLRKRRN